MPQQKLVRLTESLGVFPGAIDYLRLETLHDPDRLCIGQFEFVMPELSNKDSARAIFDFVFQVFQGEIQVDGPLLTEQEPKKAGKEPRWQLSSVARKAYQVILDKQLENPSEEVLKLGEPISWFRRYLRVMSETDPGVGRWLGCQAAGERLSFLQSARFLTEDSQVSVRVSFLDEDRWRESNYVSGAPHCLVLALLASCDITREYRSVRLSMSQARRVGPFKFGYAWFEGLTPQELQEISGITLVTDSGDEREVELDLDIEYRKDVLLQERWLEKSKGKITFSG